MGSSSRFLFRTGNAEQRADVPWKKLAFQKQKAGL
jgi:hypothetical protein